MSRTARPTVACLALLGASAAAVEGAAMAPSLTSPAFDCGGEIYVALPDPGAPTKAKLERAIEGHVLGRAELVGTYQKHR